MRRRYRIVDQASGDPPVLDRPAIFEDALLWLECVEDLCSMNEVGVRIKVQQEIFSCSRPESQGVFEVEEEVEREKEGINKWSV